MDRKGNFQFKGFIPDRRVKNQTRFFYSLIESRSPSDSKKTASLTKKGNCYEARLRLSSAESCSFEIFSKKGNVSDSMNSLKKQFLDKIIRWNQERVDKFSSLQK